MKHTLLIVDDDDEACTQMRWALASEYEVVRAPDRTSALKLFASHRPSVVLLDLGLPPHTGTPEEGLKALASMQELDGRSKIVIVSGQSDRQTAMQAVGAGAYDFISKPVDLDEVKLLLKRCFHLTQLERDFRALQRTNQPDSFDGMLGSSSGMQRLFASIRKVAASSASVLILGESGTGKEMVARAIHNNSPRREGPFVPINCSAIPETLLESELFGHEKGAFTGAHIQRKGRIEQASGGTLFLDEIGEVPPAIQVKLLRFLQEQRIERVGGREEITVDARIVAATNADLEKSIQEGSFREDFFYRLAVVRLNLPALRDREGDLRLLAQAFLHRFAAENGRQNLGFGPEALAVIQRHSWPGNIRELQNRVRRAVIMGDGPRLTPDDLELTETALVAQASSLKEAREALERELVTRALKKHHWKITGAAVELGISRPTLYELIERLGLERPKGDSVELP